MARPPRVVRRPRSPGWYDDPWGVARRRWFDGERWTSRVTEPLDLTAAGDAPPARHPHRRRPRRALDAAERGVVARAPRAGVADDRALAVAFVALATGAPLTFLLLLVAQEQLPGEPIAEAAAFLAVWASALAAAVVVRKRFGHHLGLRFRPADLLGGLLVAWAIAQLHELVVQVVAATTEGGLGPQSGFVTPPHAQPDHLFAATLVLVAVVGPLAEEVLLRGVLQPALSRRVPIAAAIAVQAVVAGVLRANPGLGPHTLSVVVTAAAAGAVLGVSRYLTGRSGPGLLGHAAYQALVAFAVLAGA